MPPYEQTEEQRRRAYEAAGVPYTPPSNAITSEQLGQQTQLKVPQSPPARDFSTQIDSNLQALLNSYNQTTPNEQLDTDLRERILQSVDVLGGEKQRTRQLEQEQGLPQQRQELQNVINQLTGLSREAQAIPLQIQQEFAGRGVTAGGVAPIQTGRLRENAIKALGLSAIGASLQGNIALAQQNIKDAIEAEFEPEKTKLQLLQQLYGFNKDTLEREDKKRTESLRILLGERERVLKIQETEKKEIYDIGLTAQKFGAPPDVVQEAFRSGTREEALLAVGRYIQDPKAKLELQNAILDSELTKLKIEREHAELDIFRRYGGLTPAQWLQLKKQEEKDREESEKQLKEADAQAFAQKKELAEISNTSTQIDAILNSNALDTVVGTNIFSRGTGRQKGKFSTFLSGATGILTLGGTTGIVDEFRNADDTVALTEQILSEQFLDKLITVKGQGATFGALTDREGNALRSAANAIAATKIEKDGRVIGYDMSEKEFKKQIGIIKESLALAREEIEGTVFTQDEQQFFDFLEEGMFNPEY